MSFETVATISAITEAVVISGIVFTLIREFVAQTRVHQVESSHAGTVADPLSNVAEFRTRNGQPRNDELASAA